MNIPRTVLKAAAGLLACLALATLSQPARAEYPEKPIRVLIPYAAGGATDVLARALARHFADVWGQSVVPDNRPGANGIISSDLLAKSAPDGYTLAMVAMGHAINPLLYKKLPYDTDRDFTPLSLVATYPQAVLVPATSPFKDLKSLLQRAAAPNSPPLSGASGGPGSSQQLATALFASMAAIKVTDIPYKGGAPALLAAASGEVDLFITLPSQSFLQGGKVRALAVTTPERLSWLPNVPTVAEAGVPGYESVAWYGLIGPKGMAPELVRKISEEVNRALATQAVRDVAAAQGGVPAGSTPEAFKAFIASERKRYEPIIRAAHITMD